MDGEGLDLDSDFPPPPKAKKCASGVDGGVDRISQLPNEILFLILSLLPVRKAASTTVLSFRWLNLWKEIPNLKFNLKSDRISQLPDHILIVILSFLSMKRAATTGVLSSRWSDVWKHSPYLNFDRYNVDADVDHQILNVNWLEAVNSVIQSHKALSLNNFRIFFPVDRSSKSTVTKWLEFVVSRRVESLELNFSFVIESDMVVLEESFREMSIVFGAPQTLFFCQSLKSLCLDCLKVGGQDVELFLHNCPLLEKLTILKAVLTSDINVCGAKLKLKCLAIRGYGSSKTVRVSAPNLSSFMFCAEVGKLVLEYAPGLVEADLMSLSSEFIVQHIALFSQLQILKLTFDYEDHIMDMFPHMPDLKKLSIRFESVINQSFLRLTDLIWASPRLEEFELRSIALIRDPSVLMEDTTNVERSPHQHLKVVKFDMHTVAFRDSCAELAMYISDNCVALREIVIRHRVEDEPVRDHLRQQLQGKIRRQIQLRFCLGRF